MPRGWAGSTRKSRLPPDWREIREVVGRRDGWRCQYVREDTGRRCLEPGRDVDHAVSTLVPGSSETDTSRMRVMCSFHHLRKSSQEGGLASAAVRKRRKTEALPKHPGVIL